MEIVADEDFASFINSKWPGRFISSFSNLNVSGLCGDVVHPHEIQTEERTYGYLRVGSYHLLTDGNVVTNSPKGVDKVKKGMDVAEAVRATMASLGDIVKAEIRDLESSLRGER